MPIFTIDKDGLHAVGPTSFEAEGLRERQDIQRLLRDNIEVLGERLFVVAEEFGDWLDSSRRIDLLCLDPEAKLVVIELKRTDDGGFMDLQALRYAAMVSAMTFEQLVEVHARFLNRVSPNVEAARARIMEFLGWEEASEDKFADDTRIILAAADFGKELTTSVMWLLERGIEIRCVRLKPYRMDHGAILLDIQQIIPLPEAIAFQTQIGVKRQAERQTRSERHELRYQYWEALLAEARSRCATHANRSPTKDNWISGGVGRAGFSLNYVVREETSQVELWIGHGAGQKEKNKQAFHLLQREREAIESDFGDDLNWEELPAKNGARISYRLPGGYRAAPEQMTAIRDAHVDAMTRLERVMRPRVQALTL